MCLRIATELYRLKLTFCFTHFQTPLCLCIDEKLIKLSTRHIPRVRHFANIDDQRHLYSMEFNYTSTHRDRKCDKFDINFPQNSRVFRAKYFVIVVYSVDQNDWMSVILMYIHAFHNRMEPHIQKTGIFAGELYKTLLPDFRVFCFVFNRCRKSWLLRFSSGFCQFKMMISNSGISADKKYEK